MIVHVLCLLIWAARAVELTEILLNSHFDEEYKDGKISLLTMHTYLASFVCKRRGSPYSGASR